MSNPGGFKPIQPMQLRPFVPLKPMAQQQQQQQQQQPVQQPAQHSQPPSQPPSALPSFTPITTTAFKPPSAFQPMRPVQQQQPVGGSAPIAHPNVANHASTPSPSVAPVSAPLRGVQPTAPTAARTAPLPFKPIQSFQPAPNGSTPQFTAPPASGPAAPSSVTVPAPAASQFAPSFKPFVPFQPKPLTSQISTSNPNQQAVGSSPLPPSAAVQQQQQQPQSGALPSFRPMTSFAPAPSTSFQPRPLGAVLPLPSSSSQSVSGVVPKTFNVVSGPNSAANVQSPIQTSHQESQFPPQQHQLPPSQPQQQHQPFVSPPNPMQPPLQQQPPMQQQQPPMQQQQQQQQSFPGPNNVDFPTPGQGNNLATSFSLPSKKLKAPLAATFGGPAGGSDAPLPQQRQQQPLAQQQQQQQQQYPPQQPQQQPLQPNAASSAPAPNNTPGSGINPAQMPRMPENSDIAVFTPACGVVPPLAHSSYFTETDQNNPFINPRLMRMSHNVINRNKSVMEDICLPLGGCVQPLADPMPGEEPLPVRDLSTSRSCGVTAFTHPEFFPQTTSGGSSLDASAAAANTGSNGSNTGLFSWFGLGGKASNATASTTEDSMKNDLFADRDDQPQPSSLNPDAGSSGTTFPEQGSDGSPAALDASIEDLYPYDRLGLDPQREMNMASQLGPLRCERCRAYANPFFMWHANGKSFTCNFCSAQQIAPPHWAGQLDGDGLRTDRSFRQEFAKSAIEYIVPPFFARNLSLPPKTTQEGESGNSMVDIICRNVEEESGLKQLEGKVMGQKRNALKHAGQTQAGLRHQKLSKTAQLAAELDIPPAFTPHYVCVLDATSQSTKNGIFQKSLSWLVQSLKQLVTACPRAKVTIIGYNDSKIVVPCFHQQTFDVRLQCIAGSFSAEVPYLTQPAYTAYVSVSNPTAMENTFNMLSEFPTCLAQTSFPQPVKVSSLDSSATTSSSATAGSVTAANTQAALVNAKVYPNCAGQALMLAYYLCEQTSGKILAFMTQPPSSGVGKLPLASVVQGLSDLFVDPKTKQITTLANCANTPFENDLFLNDQFYHMLGVYSAYRGITFDIFFCPVYSCSVIHPLIELCTLTGGSMFYYRDFDLIVDGDAVYHDFLRSLTRSTAFNAVMTLRASTGLEIGQFYANAFVPHKNELVFSALDPNKSVAFTLQYSSPTLSTVVALQGSEQQHFGGRGKNSTSTNHQSNASGGAVNAGTSSLIGFNPASRSYVQSAVLFQSPKGNVRLRVFTAVLDVVNDHAAVYRGVDLAVVVNLLLKIYLSSQFSNIMCHYNEQILFMTLVETLYTYRTTCASALPVGQLILPDKLRLLPLTISGIAKHPLLRLGTHCDERSMAQQLLRSLSPQSTIPWFVPRLYNLTGNIDAYRIQDNIHSQQLVVTDPAQLDNDLFGEYVQSPAIARSFNTVSSGNSAHLRPENTIRVMMPPAVELSAGSTNPDQIYLLDDTLQFYIWVGCGVPVALRQLLFETVTQTVEVSNPATNQQSSSRRLPSSHQSQQQQQHGGQDETKPPVFSTTQHHLVRLRPAAEYSPRWWASSSTTDQSNEDSAGFNPYDFYAWRLLHKMHNIFDHIRRDGTIYQRIHVIHAVSSPTQVATPSSSSKLLRTYDEIAFAQHFIEDAVKPPTSFPRDPQQYLSYALPNNKSVSIVTYDKSKRENAPSSSSYSQFLIYTYKSICAKIKK